MMTHPKTRLPILTMAALALGLAGLAGCASGPVREVRTGSTALPAVSAAPGMRFATLEDAAIAALVHARSTARAEARHALLVGAIVHVDDGYTFLAPSRSESYFQSRRDPVVRLTPHPDQVATYLVHPRTGDYRIDRANEDFTSSEKQIVDRLDPQHRPLYLMTPSGRIVSYRHEGASFELADYRGGRVARAVREAIAAR